MWPKAAFPDTILTGRLHEGYPGALSEFVRSQGTALVTGALGREPSSGKPTNSMFFIDRDGGMADRPYDKVHLLIFGEYFPFSDRFPVPRPSGWRLRS